MNNTDFIGTTLCHTVFGDGVITGFEANKITIDFKSNTKAFPVAIVLQAQFFRSVSVELKAHIEQLLQAEKEKPKQADPVQTPAVITSKPAPKKTTKKSKNTIWLKFEGQQSENAPANLHRVEMNGKTWYVLNYTNSKRPTNVKDGDLFFMSEGLTDDYGNSYQVITGRGHLCAFNISNVSPESWYKSHPWMVDRQWYVIIKDFEELNTNKRNCLRLRHVTAHCGSETYEASSGLDRSLDYVNHMHTQKIHMKLTETAADYINTEFDKMRDRYGSIMHYSEI